MSEKDENKVEKKKRMKEAELVIAAYELFISKGTKNTSIDDIVKKAGVAKGTFYLYFQDKYDILNKIILQKASEMCRQAMNSMEKQKFQKFDDKCLFFIDHIINCFTEDKLKLKLINKNLSWVVIRRALMKQEEYKEMEELVNFFIDNLKDRGMDREQAMINLFFIFELIGSVCYSAIILQEPTGIEAIKPMLYNRVLQFLY